MAEPEIKTDPVIVVDPNAPKPWFDGADAELVGHLKNKGWDTKPANEVALTAVKAHREAEKFIGAPADKLIRLPTEASDEKGWNDVWAKLGAPADKSGYDFTSIKDAAGAARTGAVIDAAREIAAELHLPKDVATRLADRFVKFTDAQATETKSVNEAKLVEQRAALDKNWGANAAVNREIAKTAATKLGVPPEAVTALESVIGYDKVMEMFRTVGVQMGEARFIQDPQNPSTNIMSKDQARARINELKADEAYVTSYLAGDAAKVREMGALHLILSS